MSIKCQIKTRIKKWLRSGKTPNSDALWKRTEPYSCVSFDIFDTLVKRMVQEPSDVFSLVEEKFNSAADELRIKNFKQMRTEAEMVARKEATKDEVTLAEIYNVLYRDLGDIAERLRELELSIEYDLLVPNPTLLEVYEKAVLSGKTILITSDTYFSREFIEKILSKCGYQGWHHLILSSEIGERKRTGKLFDEALRLTGINHGSLIHVGDAPIEDYVQPIKKGLAALRVPTHDCVSVLSNTYQPVTGLGNRVSEGVVSALLRDSSLSDSYRVGVEVLGPMLHGFSEWLNEQLAIQGIDKVFFLSRDGYIMKDAFERLSLSKDFETAYFYVSRQSLRTVTLWMHDKSELSEIVQDDRFLSVKQLMENVGLDSCDYQSTIEECGLDDTMVFARESLLNEASVYELIDRLWDDVVRNSKKQYERFLAYAEAIGMRGRFAIVDIGWHGTMQNYLSKIFLATNRGCQIDGYYLGLRESVHNPSMHGFLFNNKEFADVSRWQSAYLAVIELMFFSREGSTKNYSGNLDAPANTFPYEYAGSLESRKFIDDMQRGAKDYLDKLVSSKLAPYAACSKDHLNHKMETLGLRPSKRILANYANLLFYDGEFRKLLPDCSLAHYLFHPKEFYQSFDKSRWKAGFIKKEVGSQLLTNVLLRFMYGKHE